MKQNIFTGELTWKGGLGVLAVLAAGVGVFYGGQFVLQKIQSRPKSVAAVKDQIFDYIEEKSGCHDFALAVTAQETTSLSNEVVSLKAELTDLQEKVSVLQKQLRTNRDEYATANIELRRAKRAAGIVLPKRATLRASTDTNAPAGSNTTTVASTTVSNAVFDVIAASLTNETLKPLAEKEKALSAKQQAISSLARELDQLQSSLNSRQKAFNLKQREYNSLQDGSGTGSRLARECQQRFQQAASWDALYKAIGQELWLADKWLSSTNPASRHAGLQLADQARGHVLNVAENGWLAARICEAFIWPNVEEVENNGNTAVRDQYLVSAGLTFRQVGETNNYIKNAEMLISKSSSPARADYARYQLGFMFEQMGNYEASLKQYRSIQSTNSMLYAARRIPIVEERLKSLTGQNR